MSKVIHTVEKLENIREQFDDGHFVATLDDLVSLEACVSTLKTLEA